jgi:hypothetical protein
MNQGKNADYYFDRCFEWLKNVFRYRMSGKVVEPFKQVITILPLPARSDSENSVFYSVVNESELNEAEQLVLLLSLSPFYIQNYLNEICGKGENDISEKIFFTKSLVSKNMHPTLDTAMFLLGGNTVLEKQKFYYVFNRDSTLYKDDLIEPPNPAFGEPFTRANLIPSQSILSRILSGELKGPEFSHDFPATQITSKYEWDDLIIDYETRLQLEEIKEWLEYENICQKEGVDMDKFKRGFKCLFHGPPGTGKTLAASLIGKLTGHKVYRIDLSSVVSKYIGETEKNLAKIFDRAAHGNWILFFDEADALFGKRSSTQNAHDRYANQEVSYLLQRFESYEGVSILASNFKENIDTAFYRRFHSIVSFKRPSNEERLSLWRKHLPKDFEFATDINLEDIANTVKLTGAGIYNVMRRSCMKAVLNQSRIVSGKDMYDSVKLEMAKENKTLIS